MKTIAVESLHINAGDDISYDPFKHRDVKKPTSTIGTLLHLIKGSLGTGILAMPLAFKNGGLVFGFIGTALVAVIYAHCIHLLVGTSQKICRRKRFPSLEYAQTAEQVFLNGPPRLRRLAPAAKAYIDYMILLLSFFSVSVYLVFISTNFRNVLNHETDLDWDIRSYILLTAVVIAVITQIRELKYLVPFSLLANFSILVVFAICLFYIFKLPLRFEEQRLWPDVTQLPSFFGTVVYALEGMAICLPVENKMKNPQYFLRRLGVVNGAIFFITVLYNITGFFGYGVFGADVQGSVTLNLPQDDLLAKSTQILAAGAILLTTGLYYYVPMEILWRKIGHRIPEKWHNWTQIGCRFAIVLIMTILALTVPKLEPFIGFVGSIGSATLGLLNPILLDTVYRWPNHFGWMNWHLVKNLILGAFALLILAVGTYFSMLDIIAIYK
ncbi:proton-coupled amino acid transporter-like protein CG1139 [Uranotaenia lowii]|uniref:proton-coupled amino acid transporter-like protein CG1139 n=1 Tax=Uranotaenia lowii TaxID=190385 RepID=UPI002479F8AC|nr:proton-coupled amino acid transporter-like protein CG1139 [Uranotaenia lowii]